MDSLEKPIFKGMTLSDLFAEIHTNSVETRRQVKELILSLTPLVSCAEDATILVPLIKEYMEVSVKNDELLVKLATIIQRIETGQGKGSKDDPYGLLELQNLIQEQKDIDDGLKTKE